VPIQSILALGIPTIKKIGTIVRISCEKGRLYYLGAAISTIVPTRFPLLRSVQACTVGNMESLSLTDARAQLPQLLDRVAAGESFTITRHGVAVAVLTGHDAWMKTKTHDAILRARALGAEREAMRGNSFGPRGEPADPALTDEMIAYADWAKGDRETDAGRRL
jgi:prevent-host-death family protein